MSSAKDPSPCRAAPRWGGGGRGGGEAGVGEETVSGGGVERDEGGRRGGWDENLDDARSEGQTEIAREHPQNTHAARAPTGLATAGTSAGWHDGGRNTFNRAKEPDSRAQKTSSVISATKNEQTSVEKQITAHIYLHSTKAGYSHCPEQAR